MTPSMGKNADMIRAMKFGFWIGTKRTPRRAVRWEPTRLEDGRETLRGRNWVEVLPVGSKAVPERFFAADVEMIGPNEWLTYYPAVEEPICGWGRPRLPDGVMQHCPRQRREVEGQLEAFCPKHMTELQDGSEGEEKHGAQESGSGGE